MSSSTPVPKEWIRNKSDEVAISQGCYIDFAAAERVIKFLEKFLRNATGEWAGKPFKLIPWQQDFVTRLYGWKRADGRRRFTRFGLGIPKKNGKSTFVAALALYHLIADGEASNEVYIASSSKEQARIVFREATKFINASPALDAAIRIRDYWSKLESRRDPSFLQVLANENKGKHGFNAGFVLFDEFHEQLSSELWNTLRYAGRARRQPINGWISTVGFDPERPWSVEWDYANGVIDGSIIDIDYLAVIYELKENEDHSNEDNWKRVNPSLGYTFSLETMRGDYTEAVNKGGITLRDFRILMLNQRTREGLGGIDRDIWDSLVVPGVQCRGDIYAALDLASTRDLNALSFVSSNDGKLQHEVRFWCPEELNKKEACNTDLYRAWTERGWLTRTPGSYIDWDKLHDDILPLLKARKPKKILIDPYNASPLITLLRKSGYEVVSFTQTFINYNPAVRELDRLVAIREVEHQGSPVMAWCIRNCSWVQNKSGYLMPGRPKDRTKKIDGVPSMLMALAELIRDATPETQFKEFTSW